MGAETQSLLRSCRRGDQRISLLSLTLLASTSFTSGFIHHASVAIYKTAMSPLAFIIPASISTFNNRYHNNRTAILSPTIATLIFYSFTFGSIAHESCDSLTVNSKRVYSVLKQTQRPPDFQLDHIRLGLSWSLTRVNEDGGVVALVFRLDAT